MQGFILAAVTIAALAGCGGAMQSECEDTGKTTAALQIAVAGGRASAELFMRGDCRSFTCVAQGAGGCTLWQGEIDTAYGSSCTVTLSSGGTVIDRATVAGADACATGRTKVTVGD